MQHKKTFAAVVAGLLAVVAAITVFICVERVPVGYVGVVYSGPVWKIRHSPKGGTCCRRSRR